LFLFPAGLSHIVNNFAVLDQNVAGGIIGGLDQFFYFLVNENLDCFAHDLFCNG